MSVQNQLALFRSKRAYYAASLRQTAIQKRVRWDQRGTHYMRATRINAGQLVVSDPANTDRFAALLMSVYPAMATAYQRHLVPVAESAFGKWPVFSGLSKSLVDFQVTSTAGEIIGAVSNIAPYAAFIHRGKVYRALVFAPGKAAAESIARHVKVGGT